MIKNLAPIKFPVDEEGEHVREHWSLPIIYADGIFKSVPCKDAGLRVALNLAECFNLGNVKWSGAPANIFQLKIEIHTELLRPAINNAIKGLQEMYN